MAAELDALTRAIDRLREGLHRIGTGPMSGPKPPDAGPAGHP